MSLHRDFMSCPYREIHNIMHFKEILLEYFIYKNKLEFSTEVAPETYKFIALFLNSYHDA